MKQQQYEKMLIKFEEAVQDGSNPELLRNLACKSKILREGGDKSASVIKELINHED